MPAIADFEPFDQAAQLGGHLREFLRGFHGFMRARRRALRGMRHTRDVLADFGRASGGFGDVSRHLIGRRTLFLDRRCNVLEMSLI